MNQREIDREEWRDVVGYEGLYEVSSHGRVRSLDRYITDKRGGVRFQRGKIIRLHKSRTGYMRVAISRNCESYNTGVHRLVDTGGQLSKFKSKFGAFGIKTGDAE